MKRVYRRALRAKYFASAFAGLLFASIAATAAPNPAPFSLEDYRRECGGKHFPACNDWSSHTGKTQWSIFEHARAWAKSQGKLVLAVSGYDWCAPCVIDLLEFSERGGDAAIAALVKQNYVIISVDRQMSGANYVLAELGLPASGFHEIAIYDPSAERPLQTIANPFEFGIRPFRCELLPMGDGTIHRYPGLDVFFDAKLEFLKNPRIKFADLVKDRNAAVNESCQDKQRDK